MCDDLSRETYEGLNSNIWFILVTLATFQLFKGGLMFELANAARVVSTFLTKEENGRNLVSGSGNQKL